MEEFDGHGNSRSRYGYIHLRACCSMAHKTLKEKGNLLDCVRSLPPDRGLAAKVERVLEKRSLVRLRATGR